MTLLFGFSEADSIGCKSQISLNLIRTLNPLFRVTAINRLDNWRCGHTRYRSTI